MAADLRNRIARAISVGMCDGPEGWVDCVDAADAVLAELGLTQAEPVAWIVYGAEEDGEEAIQFACETKQQGFEHIHDQFAEGVHDAALWVVRPVYAAPQPQPQPQLVGEVGRALQYLDRYLSAGLAAPDWAIHLASILTGGDGAGAFRDAAPQTQPQAEPVAFVAEVHLSRYTLEWSGLPLPEGTKLYAAPPCPQASADDVAKWAQRLDDGYDSAESPQYVEFYRKDVVYSVIREMRASLGVES
jgi:hypothetical protein